MRKFRIKSEATEAVQLWNIDGKNTVKECYEFVGDSQDFALETDGTYINLRTSDETMRVNDGDWIIKGKYKKFFSCSPDVFEKFYEEVKDAER